VRFQVADALGHGFVEEFYPLAHEMRKCRLRVVQQRRIVSRYHGLSAAPWLAQPPKPARENHPNYPSASPSSAFKKSAAAPRHRPDDLERWWDLNKHAAAITIILGSRGKSLDSAPVIRSTSKSPGI
jgi:hypothetical protein